MSGTDNRRILADISLLIVVAVWGYTFVAIKDALVLITPFNFIAIRFIISLLLLVLIFRKDLKRITSDELKGGAVIGVFLFLAYAFQTTGLKYTTASNAGFITGFSVVLVPVFSSIFMKSVPDSASIAGVILSAAGLFLLSYNGSFTLNRGDILVFFCAIAVAMHILTVGYYSGKNSAVRITIIQVAVVTVLSVICAVLFEDPVIPRKQTVWGAIAVCSVFATVGAYLVQNIMQRFTSPTHTALIFSGEPVFAGIFGCFLLGETLSANAVTGCVLILAGMCVSELKVFRNNGE